MAQLPDAVRDFLRASRIAVAGVSRDASQPANAIYKKLREAGHEVFAINPNADAVEGERCYPDLAALPESVESVMVATHPDAASEVIRQCAEHGVKHVWFHRSFGQGSVSDAAVAACREHGIESIVGGCPLMYCEPVDLGHRCMRWWLGRRGRVPR